MNKNFWEDLFFIFFSVMFEGCMKMDSVKNRYWGFDFVLDK